MQEVKLCKTGGISWELYSYFAAALILMELTQKNKLTRCAPYPNQRGTMLIFIKPNCFSICVDTYTQTSAYTHVHENLQFSVDLGDYFFWIWVYSRVFYYYSTVVPADNKRLPWSRGGSAQSELIRCCFLSCFQTHCESSMECSSSDMTMYLSKLL